MARKNIGSEENVYGTNGEAKNFNEAMKVIKKRLKFLRVDLGIQSSVEDSLITEFSMLYDGTYTNEKMLDYYTHIYVPCKVSSLEPVFCGQGDMNDTMIDFSEGYDKFIKELGKEYADQIIRKRDALILLNRLLSLTDIQTNVLYNSYFKAYESKKIFDFMFISKATFFRAKNDGIMMLTSFFYPELYVQYRNKKK